MAGHETGDIEVICETELSMRILLGWVMGLAKIKIQQGKLDRYRCRNWS